MSDNEDRIGICSFDFRTERHVIDPLCENMYSQVSLWMLPVIEEVFGKAKYQDYRIKIDRLDIDLGKIVCTDHSLRDVQSRFYTALETELTRKIENGNNGSSESAEVMTKKNARIYYLAEYLQFGYFSCKQRMSPQELLCEILESDIRLLIDMIRISSHRADAIKRLVWQFNIDSVEKTAAAIEPSEREFLIEFISYAKSIRSAEVSHPLKLPETDISMYHRQVLEFTFQYFLAEKNVQFNRRDFVEDIIMKLSSHYNMDFICFVNTLISTADNAEQDTKAGNQLYEILDEIGKRYRIQKRTEVTENESFEETSVKFMRTLRSDTMHADTMMLWDRMHFLWNDKILAFMMENIRETKYVRNLVAVFDRRRIAECITVLCAEGSEFICKFADAAEERLPFAIMQINRYNDGTAPLRQQVLEFIFRYLLHRNGGAFNELEFTRNILDNIVAHHNLSYMILLNAVIDCLKESGESPEQYKSLIIILVELRKEREIVQIRETELKSLDIHSEKGLEILDVKTEKELTEEMISHMTFPFLFRYLEYFITRQSVQKKNGIRRDALLNVLQNRFQTEFKDGIRKIIFEKPHMYRYINDDCFLLNDNTIAAAAGIFKKTENAVLAGDLFRKIRETRMTGNVAALRLIFDATVNECSLDEERIEKIARFCDSAEIKKWLCDRVKAVIRDSHGNTVWQKTGLIDKLTEVSGEKNTHVKMNDMNNLNLDKKISNTSAMTENVRRKIKSHTDRLHEEASGCVRKNGDSYLMEYLRGSDKSLSMQIKNKLISELENLIVNNSDLLIHMIHSYENKSILIKRMIPLLSENMFFRLMHILTANSGVKTYQYYTAMRNAINRRFNGEDICVFTEKLKCIMFCYLIEEYNTNIDIERIVQKVMTEFTEEINSWERDVFVLQVIDEIKKESGPGSVADSIIAKEIALHETEQNQSVETSHNVNNINRETYSVTGSNKAESSVISEEELPDEIYVENAGMIIGAPYFERLFSMLGYIDGKKFRDDMSVNKAMKVLHYFSRHKTECFENSLFLNKILCGVRETFIADIKIELTEKETQTADGLVEAIIKNWTKISTSKSATLRESFLQRSGTLVKNDNGWLLKVDHRSFDMLIDTLPWGISMIKYPWMKGLLSVEWKWV